MATCLRIFSFFKSNKRHQILLKFWEKIKLVKIIEYFRQNFVKTGVKNDNVDRTLDEHSEKNWYSINRKID